MSSRPSTAPPQASDFTRKNLVGSSSSSSSSSTNTSHKTLVTALAWSASGKKLASASGDGVVKVWGVSSDTVHSVSKQHTKNDEAAAARLASAQRPKPSPLTCLLLVRVTLPIHTGQD